MFKLLRNVEEREGDGRKGRAEGGGRASVAAEAEGKEETSYKGL